MNKNLKLGIVIPCYNESDTVICVGYGCQANLRAAKDQSGIQTMPDYNPKSPIIRT